MKPDYWDRAKRTLARKDPIMAAIIRSRPKVFLARRGEPFVTLSRAIVGQQISVKAAQSVWDKVCLCAGEITPQSVLARKRSEVRGIGRWTAEMFLIFSLLRPDVFPLDDLGLQKAIRRAYFKRKVSLTAIAKLGRTWQPW